MSLRFDNTAAGRGWSLRLRVALACALCVPSLLGAGAGAIAADTAQPGSHAGDEAAVDKLAVDDTAAVARAAAMLDRYHGDRADLEAARAELDAVLASNPRSAPAYREYARYEISNAYLSGSRYEPEGMAKAERALDHAIELSPHYAEAFVLRGSLYATLDRRDEARTALHRAEELGTDDPWLELNWGELLLDEGKPQEGLDHCGRALARAPANIRVLSGIDECQIRAYRALGRLDDVDATYRRQIARRPDWPWPRSNHAHFLLCDRDRPDEAVDAASAALRLMDYGMGRKTLAAALYAAWSKQVLAGNAARAAAAWSRAWAFAPTDPADLIEDHCNCAHAAIAMLRSMRDTGRASAVAPVAAVLLAADAPSHAKPGMFAMPVIATGRSGPFLFLNSEADYRDQRTLTLRFAPPAIAAYRALHGADPDVDLKGKRITVIGIARRVKIAFMGPDGRPGDKYYYQTQLEVTEPWQVELETERPPPPPNDPMPATRV